MLRQTGCINLIRPSKPCVSLNFEIIRGKLSESFITVVITEKGGGLRHLKPDGAHLRLLFITTAIN